jgi:hypothetical protein
MCDHCLCKLPCHLGRLGRQAFHRYRGRINRLGSGDLPGSRCRQSGSSVGLCSYSGSAFRGPKNAAECSRAEKKYDCPHETRFWADAGRAKAACRSDQSHVSERGQTTSQSDSGRAQATGRRGEAPIGGGGYTVTSHKTCEVKGRCQVCLHSRNPAARAASYASPVRVLRRRSGARNVRSHSRQRNFRLFVIAIIISSKPVGCLISRQFEGHFGQRIHKY